jgi:hypothetical protein
MDWVTILSLLAAALLAAYLTAALLLPETFS